MPRKINPVKTRKAEPLLAESPDSRLPNEQRGSRGQRNLSHKTLHKWKCVNLLAIDASNYLRNASTSSALANLPWGKQEEPSQLRLTEAAARYLRFEDMKGGWRGVP